DSAPMLRMSPRIKLICAIESVPTARSEPPAVAGGPVLTRSLDACASSINSLEISIPSLDIHASPPQTTIFHCRTAHRADARQPYNSELWSGIQLPLESASPGSPGARDRA